HGTTDNTVRPAQSASFQEILDRNQVANERHTFEGIGHQVDREKAQEVFGLLPGWFTRHGLPLAAFAAVAAPVAAAPGAPPRPPADAPRQRVREKIEAKTGPS